MLHAQHLQVASASCKEAESSDEEVGMLSPAHNQGCHMSATGPHAHGRFLLHHACDRHIHMSTSDMARTLILWEMCVPCFCPEEGRGYGHQTALRLQG